MPSRFDRRHWLKRAKEMRALAQDMPNEKTKETMLRTAKEYETLAEYAPSHKGRKSWYATMNNFGGRTGALLIRTASRASS